MRVAHRVQQIFARKTIILPVWSEEHVRVHELRVEPARLVRVVVHDLDHLPAGPQQLPKHGHVVVELQEPPVFVPLVDYQPPPPRRPAASSGGVDKFACGEQSRRRRGRGGVGHWGRGGGGRSSKGACSAIGSSWHVTRTHTHASCVGLAERSTTLPRPRRRSISAPPPATRARSRHEPRHHEKGKECCQRVNQKTSVGLRFFIRLWCFYLGDAAVVLQARSRLLSTNVLVQR